MAWEDLEIKLRPFYGESFDYALVQRAYRFAEDAHSRQERRSGDPYMSHPETVAARLAEWQLDAMTIAAALLHDVAEDTPYTKKDVEREFGQEIAFLVGAVTKLKAIRYTDAAERHAESLRRMVLAFAEDIRVILIKLADRLHNMETLSFLKPHAQLRIARETMEIYAPIANRLGMGEVRGALEDLAFPILSPQEFRDLQAMVRETFEERKSFVERFIPELRAILAAETVRALDIHARVKHWWSLWQKLQRKDMSLENVYDLVAVRAVFETVEQCYGALGAIHGAWRPLPGRIKDYIALPKSNGYRSLHTTVFGPGGKIVEIQLRTREMHEEAERGIAAHWAYGETKNRGGLAEAAALARSRDLAWIQQLREWHAEFEDAGEFLESLKIDFFKDRIFVFTPKGEVIDLPDGATPVDFAYHIHSDIGDHAVGAKVNGKMMALDSKLANGDIVEIQTQKNKKPSRQWLEFVKTSIARKHIQASVKRL